jgi:hypothetical protein
MAQREGKQYTVIIYVQNVNELSRGKEKKNCSKT